MSFKSAFTPHSLWRLRRLSCRRQLSVPAGEGGAADARRGVGGEGCAAAAVMGGRQCAKMSGYARCVCGICAETRNTKAPPYALPLRSRARLLSRIRAKGERHRSLWPQAGVGATRLLRDGIGWRQEPSDAAVGLCTADFFFPGWCTRRHDFDPGRAKRAQRALCCRQRVPE